MRFITIKIYNSNKIALPVTIRIVEITVIVTIPALPGLDGLVPGGGGVAVIYIVATGVDVGAMVGISVGVAVGAALGAPVASLCPV